MNPTSKPKKEKPMKLRSPLERKFKLYWLAVCGPVLAEEHRFHPERKWRFDFAHLASRTAVEIEGGVWTGGRHTRGSGFVEDCEKYNAATMEGWAVFRIPAPLISVKDLAPIAAFMVMREQEKKAGHTVLSQPTQ
jgi:very-short-patch-repair endonuclease